MHQTELRSGTTYWRAVGPPIIDYPILTTDLTCEAVVVGGGITGALVAHQLVEAGVDTIIVDREELGAGSTAASTGLLQYEIDTPLVDLIREVGESRAVEAYRRGLRAIDELEEVANGLPESCDFTRTPALYLASGEEDLPALRLESDCRRHFGFDVHLFERSELNDFCGLAAPGAIWSRGDGELDPYRFTQGVLKEAIRCGVRALAHTAVVAVEENTSLVVVTTKEGRIKARCAIFATGYSQRFLPKAVGVLRTTYALASNCLPAVLQWPENCLIWETARPYFYARTTPDGRAILGGEDTDDSDDHEDPERINRKVHSLLQRFERLFPGTVITPFCTWAGTFAETSDGLPFIGPSPGHDRICFALGYGGNGITFSMIAARILSDHFLGRKNPDALLFQFGRC